MLGHVELAAFICVSDVLLFHVVLQVPIPVLKFLGWNLL